MISNKEGTVIIDGVSIGPKPVYKGYDGAEYACSYVVTDGAGGHDGVVAVAVVGELAVYHITTLDMSSLYRYNLSGSTTPGDTTVFVSEGFERGSISALTGNMMAHTQSDKNGNFSIRNFAGFDGTVSVWIRVSPEFAETGGVTCTAEAVSNHSMSATDIFIKKLRYTNGYGVVCPDCNGLGCAVCNYGTLQEPRYRFTGTCPEDADSLCLSAVPYQFLCTDCDGKGYKVTGGQTCSDCKGEGHQIEDCTACVGTGSVGGTQCDSCYGKGYVQTGGGKCLTCAGSGVAEVREVCESCGGAMADLPATEEVINTLGGSDALLGSSPVDGGMFDLECVINTDQLLIFWTISGQHGEINIDSTEVSEGYIKCLSGDTMIAMADGSARQLRFLRPGDHVLSGGGVPTEVLSVPHGRFHPYHVLYTFEDGTVIDEVSTHRFYNDDQGFFQHMKNWKIGEHAVNTEGRRVALIRRDRMEEEKEMFGLLTADGMYYANGLLSGPAFCNRSLLANATAEQAVDMMLSIEEEQLLHLMGLEDLLP